MALINCPECNKEISNKAKSCPNCGCPTKTKRTTKRGLAICVVATIALLGLIWATLFLLPMNVTAEERYAIQNAQDLKNMLKDPDSLMLYEDILVVFYTEKNAEGYYTYINFGAKNSYGGMNRDVAMYEGFDYIGTFSEMEEFEIKPYAELTDAEKESFIKLRKANLPYLAFNANASAVQESHIIAKEKVMKKLK